MGKIMTKNVVYNMLLFFFVNDVAVGGGMVSSDTREEALDHLELEFLAGN